MGKEVKRPPHEGIGVKPTTGKPSLHEDVLRANAGTKPSSGKPQGDPRKHESSSVKGG